MISKVFAEYIWLDGTEPTAMIRSKRRLIALDNEKVQQGKVMPNDIPEWSFDGSSTNQADGNNSDLILQPVRVVFDSVRGNGLLVLCEVWNQDETPHVSNLRAEVAPVAKQYNYMEPCLGFEQEYTLLHRDGTPVGLKATSGVEQQGKFYCGVGAKQIFGRQLADAHAVACVNAGLKYCGTNAEVMPGQWEYQIGYNPDIDYGTESFISVCDDLIISRWILHALSEQYDVHVSFHPKPVAGPWNGAGLHTNFSTLATRSGGMQEVTKITDELAKIHKAAIELYGADNYLRLCGEYETSNADKFTVGTSDRGCSVRVPQPFKGYFEDRRPAANADPYAVASVLLSAATIGKTVGNEEAA